MKSDSAIPGIIWLLVLAVCVHLLTCCADYPVTLSIHSDYGKASYSSKGGIEIIYQK